MKAQCWRVNWWNINYSKIYFKVCKECRNWLSGKWYWVWPDEAEVHIHVFYFVWAQRIRQKIISHSLGSACADDCGAWRQSRRFLKTGVRRRCHSLGNFLLSGRNNFFSLLEVMVSMCVGCMSINSVVLLSSYFAGTIWRQLRSVVPQGLLWKQCHGKSSEGTAACCYLSETDW